MGAQCEFCDKKQKDKIDVEGYGKRIKPRKSL